MTKKYGQKVEFEDNKKITINKYDGNLETKYIENENWKNNNYKIIV